MKRLALVLLAACGSPHTVSQPTRVEAKLTIPPQNDPATVDIGAWNLEWFGHPTRGPSDEILQRDNAAAVLSGLDLDIVGVEEIVDASHFASLVGALPHRYGVLANDPIVESGDEYYRMTEQKVGVILDDRFSLERARVILTEHAGIFAGRPPLELQLRWQEDGRDRTLVLIVVHLKANSEATSYADREAAANALKKYLDTEYPWRWAIVVGDWNDDLDGSITWNKPSPFTAFLNDVERYRFVTQALSDNNVSTTVSHARAIDHHLVTNELAKRYVEGSADALRVDLQVPSYESTTSDHLPVMSRYDLR